MVVAQQKLQLWEQSVRISRDSVDSQYTTKWVPVELPTLMMDKPLVWNHAESDKEVGE